MEQSAEAELTSAWHAPPEQLGCEAVVCAMLWLVLTDLGALREPEASTTTATTTSTATSRWIAAGLALIAATLQASMATYEALDGSLLFMLTPCQVMLGLLTARAADCVPRAACSAVDAILVAAAPGSAWLSFLWLRLRPPDEGASMLDWWEFISELAVHILLLVGPAVLLWLGRCRPPSTDAAVWAAAALALYHAVPLTGLAVASGVNVGFVTTPPRLPPMIVLGRWLRPLVGAALPAYTTLFSYLQQRLLIGSTPHSSPSPLVAVILVPSAAVLLRCFAWIFLVQL